MKGLKVLAVLCLTILGLAGQGAKAQQFFVPQHYIYMPHIFNPASQGNKKFAEANLFGNIRQFALNDISHSQVGHYGSAALGKKQKAGWGVLIMNDSEFTDWRLNGAVQLAIHVLNDSVKRLSIGGGVGIISVGSNYDGVPVAEQFDPLVNNFNMTELDAHLGIDLHLEGPAFEFDLGGAAFQLPGTVLSTSQPGMFLVPHAMINSAFKYKAPDSSIFIQPLFLYKRLLALNGEKADSIGRTIGQGGLDAALKFEFPRKHFWLSGMYRIQNASVGAGFGIQLFDLSDSIAKHKLDLSTFVEYPLNDSRMFGSKIELGLTYVFGNKHRYETNIIYDTIYVDNGPFWKNTSNVNDYWYKKMSDYPDGLIGTVEHSPDFVTLSYEYNDDVEQYNLVDYEEVGELLKHIIDNVLVEAFTPENTEWATLSELDVITLSSQVRFDTAAARNLSRTRYEGELGEEYVARFSYDEVPSSATFKQGQQVTNLELSLLKLLSIRKELIRKTKLKEEDITIRINPDNPNLGTFQKPMINIRFVK